MRDIKSELQIEKTELDVKIGKLRNFIGSDNYLELEYGNYLLRDQLKAMEGYSDILGDRIINEDGIRVRKEQNKLLLPQKKTTLS